MKKITAQLRLFAVLAASFVVLYPKPAWAQTILQNPIKPGSGTNRANYTMCDIGTLIDRVATIALSVAGTVAAIFIIIGALQYLLAYGDEAKATNGKNTLTWAIIGFVVIIASRFLVSLIWQHVAGGAIGTGGGTDINCV